MKYQNRWANREYLYTFVFWLSALLAVVLHAYYMNTMLYNARVESDNRFQEYKKEIEKKDTIIKAQEEQMKGMIKKPVIKKKILPRNTCK